ncbi:MAG TPA: P-loop NTPase [Gemmatimonadaceae bacterium]|nr:P-loop NTPase [Gemmatimonadaceae bacterium]
MMKRSLRLETGSPEIDAPSATLLVCSGKGGVGTSIVASLAAIAAAERGERVLLVDAGESGGSLHLLFGVRPSRSLWMLADDAVNPIDAFVVVGENLTLVAASAGGSVAAPSSPEERRAVLRNLATAYGGFDLVVFDGGSRLDTITAIAQLTNPAMLLVTSADRLALAANYALIKATNLRADDTVSVVANRHGESVAQEACDFLAGACSHFLDRSIAIVGAIPDDPCLQAAVGAGMTVRDALDGSPAADTMRGVLTRVIPSRAPAPRAPAMSLPFPSPSRRWS